MLKTGKVIFVFLSGILSAIDFRASRYLIFSVYRLLAHPADGNDVTLCNCLFTLSAAASDQGVRK